MTITLGVSLKMYFGHARTLGWAEGVAATAMTHPAIVSGAVELFVLPSFPAIVPVRRLLAGTPIRLGAQDLSADDLGAYTGEVSAAELSEIGCTLAEVGHAERRSLFGEDDETVARKTAMALSHGLTPVLCVGEVEPASPRKTAAEVIHQIDSATAIADAAGLDAPVIVAYEPVWAIGREQPADPASIVGVAARVRAHLDGTTRADSRILYGGSAGPGLLERLRAEPEGGVVDGLFLGRRAHDPEGVRAVMDEAARVAQDTPSMTGCAATT